VSNDLIQGTPQTPWESLTAEILLLTLGVVVEAAFIQTPNQLSTWPSAIWATP
jgi:hypothetical protein